MTSRDVLAPDSHECVTVVAGVIVCQDQILLGQKVEGNHPAGLGGAWLLPGGRVEGGETPYDALVREMREETGLSVEPERAMGVFLDERPNGATRILYFLCRTKTPSVRAGDDLQAVAWVARDAVLVRMDARPAAMLSPEVLGWLWG